MKTFVCNTSRNENRDIEANDAKEAAILYATQELSNFQGYYAAVWVIEKDELNVRTCYTVVVPGKCPFETDQFKRLVDWLVNVRGISKDVAWNNAMAIITECDMGYELTPGIVPISVSDRETVTGNIETFEWILAGGSK